VKGAKTRSILRLSGAIFGVIGCWKAEECFYKEEIIG
jgi:hypothetical protein